MGHHLSLFPKLIICIISCTTYQKASHYVNPKPSNFPDGFGLDSNAIAEEDVWYAFNRGMEVNFQTHKLLRNGHGSLSLQKLAGQSQTYLKPTQHVLVSRRRTTIVEGWWLVEIIRKFGHGMIKESSGVMSCLDAMIVRQIITKYFTEF